MITEKTIKMFTERNKLQQKVLHNKHTFEENIFWDIDNHCLEIKIVIGGEEHGHIFYRWIYDEENLFEAAEHAYKIVLEQYDDNSEFIPTFDADERFIDQNGNKKSISERYKDLKPSDIQKTVKPIDNIIKP